MDALYDSLTRTGPRGQVLPDAAVDLSADPSATTWTIRLRPDATFHDGSPVTAESFVASFTQQAASGPHSHLLRDVAGHGPVVRGERAELAGVRAVDPLTLEIRLARPRGDLPVLLSHPALGPVAPLGEGQVADPASPIGNGPFAMVEPWARGDFIRVGRHGDAVGGEAVGISEVLFRIGDIDQGFLAFRQARRDLATVPPEAVELAIREFPPGSPATLRLVDQPSTFALVLDRDIAPYDDERVREAVQLMVDRAAVAELSSLGRLVPATSLLPAGGWGDNAGMCDLCTFNPSGASQRLQDAGVTQLTLAFDGGAGNEAVRDQLRDDLSDIGISLVSNDRRPAPAFADYLARLEQGDVGMFRFAVAADVPSAYEVLQPLLHSTSTPRSGGLNYTGYRSPRVDALLDQAAVTQDPKAREALMDRVEEIVVNRDHVVVPVVGYQQGVVLGDRTVPFRISPFTGPRLVEIRPRG